MTAFVTFLLQLVWRFVLGGTLPVLAVHTMPGTARWHPGGPQAAAEAFHNNPTPYLPLTGICLFWGGAVASVCLFFGQQIRYRLFGTSPQVFFDKCCIHQTDNEKRKEGIHALGDAIQRSEKVVVFADDAYFSRLWCVFELASFLHFHKGDASGSKIIIQPIALGAFAVSMFLVVWIGCLVFYSIAHLIDQFGLLDLTNFLQCALFYSVMGTPVWWMPKFAFCHHFLLWRRSMERNLAQFKVRKAQCQVEADRAHVELMIVAWFGSLSAFEDQVHGGSKSSKNVLTRSDSGMSRRGTLGMRRGTAGRGLLGILQASIGSERLIDLLVLLFENMAGCSIYYDALALANDRWAVALSVGSGLTEHLVANVLYINVVNNVARLLMDARLPVSLKVAIRIIACPTLGLWFFLMNFMFFSLPIPFSYTIAVLAALTGQRIFDRDISFQREYMYMPIRVGEMASVLTKSRRWIKRSSSASSSLV